MKDSIYFTFSLFFIFILPNQSIIKNNGADLFDNDKILIEDFLHAKPQNALKRSVKKELTHSKRLNISVRHNLFQACLLLSTTKKNSF